MLKLEAHKSSSYGPRTYANANRAGLTVAFAVDFTTAGEACTHRAAGDRYVACPLDAPVIDNARLLYSALRRNNANVLNVAGNGVYTLHAHGVMQTDINQYVYNVLKIVSKHWPIDLIVSGGQTGVDQAGLVAAVKLGINASGLLPAGFKRRGIDRRDINCNPETLVREFLEEAEYLTDFNNQA